MINRLFPTATGMVVAGVAGLLLAVSLPHAQDAQSTNPPLRAEDMDMEDGHEGVRTKPDLLPSAPAAGEKPPAVLDKVGALEKVAVLHEGRVKPMETFSRHMLLQFSGRTTYKKNSALQVMSKVLFTPELVGDYAIFLINNPEVVESMGVTADKHRRYSFRQLEKGLAKLEVLARKAEKVEDEKRDIVQKEVLRVFGNLVQFVNLAGTFSFVIPTSVYSVHEAGTLGELQLPQGQTLFSFWDLMGKAPRIAKVLEGIGERGDNQRTATEKEIIALSQNMYLNSQSLRASVFHVLPQSTAKTPNAWISPPEAVAAPQVLQSYNTELSAWAGAIAAFRAGKQPEFDKEVRAFTAAIEGRAFEQLDATHFPLEVAYQKGEPFYRSLVLYWMALLGVFSFFLWRKRWIYRAALWAFLAGYVIHVAAIVSRILIMHRPPVTSLYETFPFVAAVSILAALLIERTNAKRASAGIGLLSASLLGVILLSIAGRYAAEGDTMRMLVAVLNSNFWLSTHVICVTIGYSACLLAGAIGHIWLIRALGPANEVKTQRLKEIGKMVYGTICFGLLFSFIGTVLGGIWADQSWGRFWGWDPKENGALLIVVWCIILLHAKQWGYIRDQGLALGSVFGAITVSLAWFGVNLLNVGLHSYGFTSGAATKLFAYCGSELLFMGGVWAALKLGVGSKPAAKESKASRTPDPTPTPA